MNTEIYKALGDAGIEIPFPQHTVHIRMEGASEPKESAPLDMDRILGGDPSRNGGGPDAAE